MENNKETQKWLDNHIYRYKEDPIEELKSQLDNLLSITQQYLDNPQSHATKGILDSGLFHIKLFMKEIEDC